MAGKKTGKQRKTGAAAKDLKVLTERTAGSVKGGMNKTELVKAIAGKARL